MTQVETTGFRRTNKGAFSSSFIAAMAALRRLWKTRNHPHIRSVKPRMLRDVGLSTADLARHHIKLPSQNTFHPRG